MNLIRSTTRPGRARRRVAALGALFVMAFVTQLTLAGPAAAAPFTGGISPTVFDGLADLNGDNEATGRDDSNAFYGDTHIIDGGLDCNAWGATANEGSAGDGAITAADDCTLIGYDGTADGVTIGVVDGEFQVGDGPLPTVFNASDPDNPDVGDSDFAWSTINGRVDSNGNEQITADDCHFGLIGETVDAGAGDMTDGADILGNTQANTNPCGFGNPPDAANNGLVDLNSDGEITAAADSCTNGCFFGHNVDTGVVQEAQPGPFPTPPANAFTGGFSPTIVGGVADLNGDGAVTGRDDSNAFYGDTHIIDGFLDCNNWTTENDGTAGNGAITGADDCELRGYDGTADGVLIEVIDGEFQVANGPLPTVFNAADPDNNDVSDSDFAWSAIGGRVDSDGNEFINFNDCHFGLIGQTADAGLGDPTDGADILGNNAAETNPCGFGNPPDPANNGLVDLNSDGNIDAVADSCTNGCFFGLNVDTGFVVGPTPECPGYEGDPRNDVIGTPGADVLTGTAGADIICAFGGNDTLSGLGGNDLLLAGAGADLGRGGAGADDLRGARGADDLRGGRNADTLRGGRGRDVLRGGRGSDTLLGGRGNDRLFGGRGNDHLDGGRGTNDRCFGGPGADTFVRCESSQQ
ncbi:MAG TPA: calcium-binding protein [Actinomycetota bacterium]|jgi:hypothetical protein|nr:calcium-binding protein [Actinomycetota bacterium]